MTRIFHVPGIVYSGETDQQAFERDKAIAEHNAKVDEFEYKCRLPMACYRQWAKERELIEKPTVKAV